MLSPCSRLLIVFLFCFFTLNVAAAEVQTRAPISGAEVDSLEGVYDIPGTGEYEGYRKLIGHKFEKYYDIYFTHQTNGSIFSSHIVTIPLKVLDPNEIITVVLPDGEEQTATRETWYKVFRSTFSNKLAFAYFNKRYPDLCFEWAVYDSGMQPQHIAERYINANYAPKVERSYPVLLPDSKVQ